MEDIFEQIAEEIEDIPDVEAEEAVEVPARDDDGDEESKRVQPKVKRISKPRLKLDPQRLTGPRGLGAIAASFEDIKFKGKGHELDDLSNVLARLQHWAHRLYPKLNFEDCIARIEELGSKKPVMRTLESIRNGTHEDEVVEDIRAPSPDPVEEDPFDKLISTKPPEPKITLTDEQRARMLRNRLLAEERRMERMKAREAQICQDDEPTEVKEIKDSTADFAVELDDSILHAFNEAEMMATQENQPPIDNGT